MLWTVFCCGLKINWAFPVQSTANLKQANRVQPKLNPNRVFPVQSTADLNRTSQATM